MRLIERVLNRITKHMPENRISINGDTYLRRFYVCGDMPDKLAEMFKFGREMRKRLEWLPTVYLHCFHRPDLDRDLHNHPWAATSLVLSGGYIEERYLGHPGQGSCRRVLRSVEAWSFNRLDADTYHRVDTLYSGRVWTLFVIGKKVQTWGFWSEAENRHIDHHTYHKTVSLETQEEEEELHAVDIFEEYS